MHAISANTILVVVAFAALYMVFTIRKTAHQQLDLYDFAMLSMVALVPGAFVVFPRFAYWLAAVAGVEFPFVVMFGTLFAVLFVFVHRLTVRIHRLESDNRLLIQELGLLRERLDRRPPDDGAPG